MIFPYQVVDCPVLVVSPLQQRGQLQAEVSPGPLQGVQQQRHRGVGSPLQTLHEADAGQLMEYCLFWDFRNLSSSHIYRHSSVWGDLFHISIVSISLILQTLPSLLSFFDAKYLNSCFSFRIYWSFRSCLFCFNYLIDCLFLLFIDFKSINEIIWLIDSSYIVLTTTLRKFYLI